MTLSPKVVWYFYRILPFGFLWLIFGLCYNLIEKGIMGDLQFYPSTGNPYNFAESIFPFLVFAFCFGLFAGTMEVLYLSRLFVRQKLVSKIILKSIIYIVAIIVFLLVASIVGNAVVLKTGVTDSRVMANTWSYVSNFAFVSLMVYALVVVVISLYLSEVSNNLGVFAFYNFLTAKYHSPIVEERIFMFLDMKSSTAIAEQLGHIRYFRMLKEYYADISLPTLKYNGEIYQYVGDEMVITWSLKNGLHNNNFLRCFFAMKESLQQKTEKYRNQFDNVPTFKAGVHFGAVTAGEIGVLKKEITYTGDVLNTTARIQSLCNQYGVDLLLSADLAGRVDGSNGEFRFQPLGVSQLQGRKESVELVTVIR